MGARPSDYAAVAPHNSYIHVEEFANPEELAAYLHRLDEDDTLYNSYFKWKVRTFKCLYTLKVFECEITIGTLPIGRKQIRGITYF